MLKIGGKVRCIGNFGTNLEIDKIYTISKLESSIMGVFLGFGEDKRASFSESRFKEIKVSPTYQKCLEILANQ